ncbi:107_t:CDS:2, partial [Acaulospora morrowiae]
MTSVASNNVPTRKMPKKSKTGPTVRLPKPNIQSEGMRERYETTASKIFDEEVFEKNPETTNTKLDIFQTSPFLHEDKTVIVKCPPPPKKDEQKEKDSHISDALDALNGMRREPLATQEVNRSSSTMPITAIEALEKIFGKVPEQKTHGSNYGRLAQDFTFPPRNKSTAGSGNNVASSSKKVSESNDTKESPEEIEKKERRKSNLNALAKEFTPSFFSGSTSTTEADKSVDKSVDKSIDKSADKSVDKSADTSDSKDDDSRKKKSTRKEKLNHDLNGDSENSYQHNKKKRPQHILNQEVLPCPDNGSYVYEHSYSMRGPPTPYPSVPSHWEEFNSKMTEVVSKVQSEVQKQIEALANEIKTSMIEQNSDDTEDSSVNRDVKDSERGNESAELIEFQETYIQELRNNRQEIQSAHDELLSRYEKLQTQHLALQADLKAALQESQGDVQRTNSIQQRHIELQNMHQNLQAQYQQELSQIDEIQARLQQLLSEQYKIQESQQQSYNDLTHSQRRISELDADLKESRARVAQLTAENVKHTEENKTLNSTVSEKNSLVRDLQNMYEKLYEENQALQQRNERMSLSETNHMKNISDLNLKLRQTEVDFESSKIKIRELENLIEDLKIKENSSRSMLQEVENQIGELRIQKTHLQEKLEIQSMQINSKNREVEGINKEIKRLGLENLELEKKSKDELLQAHITISELNNKLTELEKAHDHNKALESQVAEYSQVRSHMKGLEKKITELETECAQVERYKSHNNELETQLKEYQQRIKNFEDRTVLLEQKQKEHEAEREEVTLLRSRCVELQKEKEVSLRYTQELDDVKKELQRLSIDLRGRDAELTAVKLERTELKTRLNEVELERSKLVKENSTLRSNPIIASNINHNYVSPADTPNQELDIAYGGSFEQYPQQIFSQPSNFIPNLQSYPAPTPNVRYTPLQQTHVQTPMQLPPLVPMSPKSQQPIMSQLTHAGVSHPYQAQMNHPPTFAPQTQLLSPISTPQ